MPKIIKNLREMLLAEAKRQISERGYEAITIRSVAGACGIGIGTVYNYFASKEMLIATVIYEQWREYLAEMASLPTDDPKVLLQGIYGALVRFEGENERLFSDVAAAKLVSGVSSERHKLLRSQIASFIAPICREDDNSAFIAEFIAESIISWSIEKTDFDLIYPILERIIKK